MRYVIAFFVAAALSIGVAGSRPAPAHADVDTSLYGTSDELVIPALSIDAPVNTRNVGEDGRMGDPAGKDDVVRYDFPPFPGLGGYPGSGGTTVVGGHVDYHPNFQAVFWSLRQSYKGMEVDYYRGDGILVKYVFDWVSTSAGDDDISQYLVASDTEGMVLISCEGSFDPSTRHYNNRTMVHAIRVT